MRVRSSKDRKASPLRVITTWKPSVVRRAATFFAIASARSFSRTPCAPTAPVSLPPCPASTTTRRTLSPSWLAIEVPEPSAVERISRALAARAGASSGSVSAATALFTARTIGVERDGGFAGASGSGGPSSVSSSSLSSVARALARAFASSTICSTALAASASTSGSPPSPASAGLCGAAGAAFSRGPRAAPSRARPGAVRLDLYGPIERPQHCFPAVPIPPASWITSELLERRLARLQPAHLRYARRHRESGTREERENADQEERAHVRTLAQPIDPSIFAPTPPY